MHILITGGTGFIGTALCNALIKNGHELTVLTRSPEKQKNPKIRYITTLKPDDYFEVIINLAGEAIVKRWSNLQRKKVVESRIGTTNMLIEFITQAEKKPSLLISGSAIGYYGTDPKIEFHEDTPPQGEELLSFARHLCHLWEKEALRAQEQGVRVCLLRIGVVLEKNGGALSRMLPSFRLGLGGTIGDGKQWMSWIHRDDLITIIQYLINHPQLNGAFNATSPYPVTNEFFTKILAKTLGRKALLKTPACVIKLLFGRMGEEILLSGQKVMPHRLVKEGFEFQHPTLEKALKEIL